MARKIKTIKLSGKEYAQVSERLRAIHEDHKDFDITTEATPMENGIMFKATLTIRDKEKCPVVVYTGHSYGKAGAVKAFEKLETIAVGRALAFAGYHADGEIASADEMQDMKSEVDAEELAKVITSIQSVKTVANLNKKYKELPSNLKHNKEILEVCKDKKKELTTIEA